MKILFIGPTAYKYHVLCLEQEDFQVVSTNFHSEIIDALKNNKFDLIILEPLKVQQDPSNLVILDGEEELLCPGINILRQIKSAKLGADPQTPVIILTNSANEENNKIILGLGVLSIHDALKTGPKEFVEIVKSFFASSQTTV